LAEALRAEGREVVLTREPGGAPGAEVLRTLLLSGEVAFTPPAEVLLHFAARAEHVERTIRPALERGAWVVCDRFADSTMAYQGWGLGGDRAMIAALTRMVGLAPDLTLVLEVPTGVAEARLTQRGEKPDRYERLPPDFHARVAAAFRTISEASPDRCVLIQGGGDPLVVQTLIMAAVRERLGG
jgi:dTMP kinase